MSEELEVSIDSLFSFLAKYFEPLQILLRLSNRKQNSMKGLPCSTKKVLRKSVEGKIYLV